VANNVATVNFVRMCLEAQKIQKRRQITIGNKYFDLVNKTIHIVGNVSRKTVFSIFNNDIRNRKRFIWLPSMLQMQDIYWRFLYKQSLYTKKMKSSFVTDIALYLGNYTMIRQFETVQFYSFQEILLAILMLDIYEKQWDGTNFINIPQGKRKKKKKGKDEDSKHS